MHSGDTGRMLVGAVSPYAVERGCVGQAARSGFPLHLLRKLASAWNVVSPDTDGLRARIELLSANSAMTPPDLACIWSNSC